MITEFLILSFKILGALAVMLAVYGVGHSRGFKAAIDMVDAEVTRRFSPKD